MFSNEGESYVTGGKVSKGKYIDELRRSKTCVSPYRWGEVCFRDFEAAINGCVLIKPEISHLDTWPNIFREGDTYVPLKWDMRDIEDTLKRVVEN